jgi:hypothetical protein
VDRVGGTDRSASHMVLHDTIKAGLGLPPPDCTSRGFRPTHRSR